MRLESNPKHNHNKSTYHAELGVTCERCFKKIDRRGNGSDVLCRKCYRKMEAHYAITGRRRICPVCGGHDRPVCSPCRRCEGKAFLPRKEVDSPRGYILFPFDPKGPAAESKEEADAVKEWRACKAKHMRLTKLGR